MATSVKHHRSERIEVRATPEERALIDRAVEASGADLAGFVLEHLTIAARRVLADRTEFVLGPEEIESWETLDSRPARDLPNLREFMQGPSPFEDG